jgi:hypothetical protein
MAPRAGKDTPEPTFGTTRTSSRTVPHSPHRWFRIGGGIWTASGQLKSSQIMARSGRPIRAGIGQGKASGSAGSGGTERERIAVSGEGVIRDIRGIYRICERLHFVDHAAAGLVIVLKNLSGRISWIPVNRPRDVIPILCPYRSPRIIVSSSAWRLHTARRETGAVLAGQETLLTSR